MLCSVMRPKSYSAAPSLARLSILTSDVSYAHFHAVFANLQLKRRLIEAVCSFSLKQFWQHIKTIKLKDYTCSEFKCEWGWISTLGKYGHVQVLLHKRPLSMGESVMLTRPQGSRPRPRPRPKDTRPRPRPKPQVSRLKTKTKTEKFGLKTIGPITT